jgi:membrane fusion protein (multidrug efflux system)
VTTIDTPLSRPSKGPSSEPDERPESVRGAPPARRWIPLSIGAGVLFVLAIGSFMVFHAESKTNKTALSEEPKAVTVIEPKRAMYRASRTYVGTIEPWVQALVGPQLVSAYVDTVLVRPGAIVKKGDVLATLDCRNASATSQAVAMQARALETRQKAVASEASRIAGLLDGGFVSPNEAEQKEAESASEQATLLAQQAKMLGTSIEVDDCVLRAPFSGEIATRGVDPGAFVRPGSAIVSLVDRATLRVTADAPEVDFDVVSPGTKVVIHVIATGKDMEAAVSRRAPAADAATRTVHFELDVPDPTKSIPVGTTGEIRVEVGEPSMALVVPLSAAVVRGARASVFVVDGHVARARVVPVKGEIAGALFLEPVLPEHARIVTDGRSLLGDGDEVRATLDDGPKTAPSATRAAGHEATKPGDATGDPR